MYRNKRDFEKAKASAREDLPLSSETIVSPIGRTGYYLEESFRNFNVLVIRHSKNRKERHSLHLTIDDVKTLHHYIGNWLKVRALNEIEEEKSAYSKHINARLWEIEKRSEAKKGGMSDEL